jgi:hypothetical protein
MGAGALDLLDVPMLGKNTADNRPIIGFVRDTLTGTLRATVWLLTMRWRSCETS